jgi:hypothetical protein
MVLLHLVVTPWLATSLARCRQNLASARVSALYRKQMEQRNEALFLFAVSTPRQVDRPTQRHPAHRRRRLSFGEIYQNGRRERGDYYTAERCAYVVGTGEEGPESGDAKGITIRLIRRIRRISLIRRISPI